MPGAPSSFWFLETVRPGAPSSTLAPSSDVRSQPLVASLLLVAMPGPL